MSRRYIIAAIVCVAAFAAAGCTARTAPPITAPRVAETTTSDVVAIAAIRPMTVDEKRAQIATSFPLEVPLPGGEVRRGEAQGDTAWDYEIIVDAPVATLSDWYKQYYTARSWNVASEDQLSGGGVKLTLLKNDAQSRIVIEPQSGEKTKATGVLGVGTPVLQTQ